MAEYLTHILEDSLYSFDSVDVYTNQKSLSTILNFLYLSANNSIPLGTTAYLVDIKLAVLLSRCVAMCIYVLFSYMKDCTVNLMSPLEYPGN